MSVTVFFAVLFAAFLHASWNAVIRFGDNRMQGMLILTIAQGSLGVLLAASHPFPTGEVWLWLLASGAIHAAYKIFLASAYQHGDLSRVYPIARGAAPMIVAVVGYFLLHEQIAFNEYIGISLISLGVMLMARDVFVGGSPNAMVGFALGSAVCTAGYSVVDGMGARVAGSATMFTGWMFMLDASLFSTYVYFSRGSGVFRANARAWMSGGIAGGLSLLAYWIVVWAMTVAPIPLVTALRETSVLIAVAIGVFILKEQVTRKMAITTIGIVAGMTILKM